MNFDADAFLTMAIVLVISLIACPIVSYIDGIQARRSAKKIYGKKE